MVTSDGARFLGHFLLPHQPIKRKSHALQPSPPILFIKNAPQTLGEFGFFEQQSPVLLAWLCNKPFCAHNSGVSVWPHCVGRTNFAQSQFLQAKGKVLFTFVSPVPDVVPATWQVPHNDVWLLIE